MVKVISISTSGDFVLAGKALDRIAKRLPPMTIGAMIKWGVKLENGVKESLRETTLGFRGKSEKEGIKWKQGKRSHVGYLFIRGEYVALDSMRPHWVNVKKSRRTLLSWAKQAKIPNIRRRAKMIESGKLKKFGIRVRPHPFIDRGFKRAIPKLNPILNRMVERAIN